MQAEKITYEDHIKDIFQNNCSNCHKPSKKKGGLNLMIYSDALKGGSSGKIVHPGDVESMLVKTVTHEEEPIMPPKGPKLEDSDIELIRSWIKGGLLETANSKRVKVAQNNSLAMTTPVAAKGTVIMPEYLNLQPYLVTPGANSVTAMSVSPYSPLVAAAGYKQVLLFDTKRLSLTGVLPFPEGQVCDIKFSRDGSIVLASGGINGKTGVVALWDVKSGKRIYTQAKDYDATMAADISSDRKFIATGSSDKLVKIFSAKDGSLLHKIKQHSEWISALSFSPDAVLLATGDRNGHIHVWECESGQKMYSLMRHKAKITSLSWRSDSNLLASSSEDGDVVVWNIVNGREAKRFRAHSNGTTDVFYTNNGHLLTTGRDKVVKFWDPAYRMTKQMKLADSFALRAVAGPDSKFAVSSSFDGSLQLWDINTQKPLKKVFVNPPNVTERVGLNIKEQEQAKKNIAKAAEALKAVQSQVDSYNGKVKSLAKTKQDSIKKQQQINVLRGKLGKLKGEERKKADHQVANLGKEKQALDKKAVFLQREIQNLNKTIGKVRQDLAVKKKAYQATVNELEFLKQENIRWQAEIVNVDRHKVIKEITDLKEESLNAKATQESLKLAIEDNIKKANELQSLGDTFKKEMTEDEALDTLVYRHDTQIRLRQEAKESEQKISELETRKAEIKNAIPGLETKEKKIFTEYKKLLPKEKKPEVSSVKK